MTKVEINLHDDIVSIMNKLKGINDTDLEVIVPNGAVLFESSLNLKILLSWSEREGKSLKFTTDDLNGQNLIFSLEDKETPPLDDSYEFENTTPTETLFPKQKIKLPKIKFYVKISGKRFIVLGIIVALLVVLGYFGFKKVVSMPRAYVKIVVNSQPLTRSVQIGVRNNQTTSADTKILKGETISATVDDKLEIPTTGEKIVGEKAEGTITIFNKTDEEKKFKKGTIITYKDDKDREFIFETKNDVTVPPREEQTPDPENPDELVYIKGKADTDVVATEVGEKYNISEGESLSVEDQKSSNFDAESKKDFDGGKEEKIKVVAQEDLDGIKQKLAENAKENSVRALTASVANDSKLINGSESVSVVKEVFSHTLGAETDKLSLEQAFSASGLIYKPEELNSLIDKLVENFIPEGFVLSTKERSVNVEVLGNTETAVLSASEADLQVTLKTFVITDISEDSVKESLMGKSVSDSQKLIGSIRNIKTYEFNLSPRLPFLDFVPKDKTRIDLEIERE